MANKRTPLEPDKFYHIYNHAVHNNNLFYDAKEYGLFMKRLEDYILPIADIYAYCLMPNHYHILLQIKSLEVLKGFFGLKENDMCKPDFCISDNISHQIGTCQNSYTKTINAKNGRKGALFMQSFGRKLVTKEGYLYKLVHYIHYNPVHHGFVGKLEDWEYSSYKNASCLEYVMDLFGDEESYRAFHSKIPDTRLEAFMETLD